MSDDIEKINEIFRMHDEMQNDLTRLRSEEDIEHSEELPAEEVLPGHTVACHHVLEINKEIVLYAA